MIGAIRRRLSGRSREAGLTLVELLIAATMSAILVGAATAMLISACQVTYTCAERRCVRLEATEDGTPVGAETDALTGIEDPAVFCFVPSTETDPSRCGAPATPSPSYVGVTLRVPNPNGPGKLTISDGATLRTAALQAG